MTDRLQSLRDEYAEVLDALGDPSVAADQRRFRQLSRRFRVLEGVVRAADARQQAREDLEAAMELLTESSAGDREVAREEVEQAQADLELCEQELELRLIPPDPNDGKDVVVEIRGAEGGEEANLFARDLYEMYLRFAERMAWKVEPLGSQVSDKGGFDEVSFALRGDAAWRRMKHEAGIHRVQRVPATESQGRVHTSSATVAVLPEADEVEVDINPADLKIDVYRSTGPGGQSVNTTDSAVRITHLPTGTVVAMQDEKSQLQNKAKALTVLRARLLRHEQDRQAAEASQARRAQVGGGGRSEKIRTYNFKENRITDHRIRVTLHKLDRVLAGELDELSDALLEHERSATLGAPATEGDES
ncbi:MAG: peptide chain release factor 1 [Actinomycetota bacterium]|nr:peptide chain release factor 1 [Actinomycetota bacterium]